jgi:hypothetical protein
MSKKILNERIKLALSPMETEVIYDEFLDECYEEVNIGVTFSPSFVLKKLDPICYNIGLCKYFDNSEDYYELDGEYYCRNEVDDLENEMEDEE